MKAVPVGHEGGIGEDVPNLHSVPEYLASRSTFVLDRNDLEGGVTRQLLVRREG